MNCTPSRSSRDGEKAYEFRYCSPQLDCLTNDESQGGQCDHGSQPLGKPLPTHHLVSSVAFSPNGRTLAAGNGDNGTVTLWDLQNHHLIATLRTGDRGPVNSVAFSRQGHTLATASENGTVQLWDARSHALLKTLSTGPGQVFSVAFSSDGRFLAAAGFTGTIRVWQKGILWRN